MPNFFRLPKSRLALIAEYNESLALLLGLIPAEENDAFFFRNTPTADLSIAALEAGVTLMKELIALKNAALKYVSTPEAQELYRQLLYFGQHLFSKVQDDINAYQLTPAHAQLLAFNHTLKATTVLVNEPNVHHGKRLDNSIKALRAAIKKDPCPTTNRLFYAVTGAFATFLGVIICASTLTLLLATPTLAGFGSVASIVLGGISGTLISTGIHLLRKAFTPRPQQTPQEQELVNCGINTADALARLANNPTSLFAARPQSPVQDSRESLSASLALRPAV